jgi:hypothetical protein
MIEEEFLPVRNNEFTAFPKIRRIFKDEIIITEKIDGTNAQIYVHDDGLTIQAGSRNRYITPEKDNYGFARWVENNKEDLLRLGPGRHFGEWWGNGIQRNYSQLTKRFSLFNTEKWSDSSIRPVCCEVVPVLYRGLFHTESIKKCLRDLQKSGSVAAPGFMDIEGIIIYHQASNHLYKYTVDDNHKGE